MARGKKPVTRLQKCVAAIEKLNETQELLRSINLNQCPKSMRPGIKDARDYVTWATRGVAASMRADVPTEATMPLRSA